MEKSGCCTYLKNESECDTQYPGFSRIKGGGSSSSTRVGFSLEAVEQEYILNPREYIDCRRRIFLLYRIDTQRHSSIVDDGQLGTA